MPELIDIFQETVAVEAARAIFANVPNDIGDFPFWHAQAGGIIENAYYALGTLAAKRFQTLGDFQRTCREQSILDKLFEAGLIESGGYCVQEELYVKRELIDRPSR